MWYGLPDQRYLEFVAQVLGKRGELIDPFSRDIGADAYVSRSKLEAELSQPAHIIIVGFEGSGKTTLFNALLDRRDSRTLIVGLRLSEVERSEGNCYLSPQLLVSKIFDAYWEYLLYTPGNCARLLPVLRQDRQWMEKLRWFRENYPPLHLQVPDFELAAWLGDAASDVFSPQVHPTSLLRELIRFITSPLPSQHQSDELSQHVNRIELLVDEIDQLPSQTSQIIQETQRLCTMYPDRFHIKLFVDSRQENQIEEKLKDYTGRDRIKLYRLPKWDTKELEQILNTRLKMCFPGEVAELGWGELIPSDCLGYADRTKFTQILVDGALRVYDPGVAIASDAPIHVLRLAQGLITACAGCWEQFGYVPPLNVEQLDQLVGLYWESI